MVDAPETSVHIVIMAWQWSLTPVKVNDGCVALHFSVLFPTIPSTLAEISSRVLNTSILKEGF